MIGEQESFETWNMAKAYLQRIDALLTHCAFCQYHDMGSAWYKTLLNLYKELDPKMTTQEREEFNTKLVLLRNAKNSSQKKNGIDTKLYIDVELSLRRFLEKKGLLTPKGDDPTKAYRN